MTGKLLLHSDGIASVWLWECYLHWLVHAAMMKELSKIVCDGTNRR